MGQMDESSKLKEFAEFLLAVEKSGGEYLCNIAGAWVIKENFDSAYLSFDNYLNGYLRLNPKEEEKKKIPLSFEDITPTTVFSIYEDKGWFKIYSADKDGVETPVQNTEFELRGLSYKDLMKYYYSEDGKTWKGCWKYDR